MKEKLSIVYDMTRRCPWNCSICCMGAVPGKEALEGELTMERKMALMDELSEVAQIRDVRIDFSGGEILTDMRNIDVIARAAKVLGREKIGISTSGFRIDDSVAKRLSCVVTDCEMTMDSPPGVKYRLRPDGYSEAAGRALPYLQHYGVRTGVQTVLARSNCSEEMLATIYRWVCEHGVDNWSLLRFYPVGRGSNFVGEVLTPELEAWAVSYIQQMDNANPDLCKPKIDFHYTMQGHSKYSSECRCVRKSIGILPNGDVTACFWAVDASTGIVAPKFRLGTLREQSLRDILAGNEAAYWLSCVHSCELGVA